MPEYGKPSFGVASDQGSTGPPEIFRRTCPVACNSCDEVLSLETTNTCSLKKNYEFIDLAKAFGSQPRVQMEPDYGAILAEHPLCQGLWAIGRYFVQVVNTHTWQPEKVTGDSLAITGYTQEEIFAMNRDFPMSFTIPEHLGFCLMLVKLAMEYLLEKPLGARKKIFAVYYYRARKKNGELVSIQQQSIPILFDAQGFPYIFSNIFTDISHLGPTNLPQGVLIDRHTDETFYVEASRQQLILKDALFSSREKEIVALLVRGYSSRQIAEQLQISYETVRTHRKNILHKAGVNNTQQLIRYALLYGNQ